MYGEGITHLAPYQPYSEWRDDTSRPAGTRSSRVHVLVGLSQGKECIPALTVRSTDIQYILVDPIVELRLVLVARNMVDNFSTTLMG